MVSETLRIMAGGSNRGVRPKGDHEVGEQEEPVENGERGDVGEGRSGRKSDMETFLSLVNGR